MMIYYCAMLVDQEHHSTDAEEKKLADELLALLTPIAKAFITETGFESANHAMQCFGGHGYIAEWGVEQNVRDARIAMLYEGTTGIQALDLLGRKVLMTQGETLRRFTKIIHKFCQSEEGNAALKEFVEPLAVLNKQWGDVTMHVGLAAMANKDEVGAASVDYLMYAGYIALGYFWAKAAKVAQAALDQGASDADFYRSKLKTARFYFQRVLPRTESLHTTIKSGAANLMDFADEEF